MDGPEHLEVGRPATGRRTGWWVVGVALALVAGLTVVRAGGLTSGPAPLPTGSTSAPPSVPGSAPPSTSPQGWPVGVGLVSGTVFVLAADGLSTVDATSGFVEQLAVEVDPATVLTPLAYGALAWSPDGGPRQLVGFAGAGSTRPTGPVRTARRVLPGAEGRVWVTVTDERQTVASTTWVEADDEHATGQRARVRGRAVPDGAGGLFAVERATVRHAYPGRPLDLGAGSVRAVGPDGSVLQRCPGGTCTEELHDRSTGRVTVLAPAGSTDPLRAGVPTRSGALSSRNRFVAEPVDTPNGDQVRVSRVGPVMTVLRTFPDGARGSAFAWVSNRWLLAVSGQHMVLYDAENDTLLTPVLPFDAPSRLVFQPA